MIVLSVWRFTKAMYNHGQKLSLTVYWQGHGQEQSLDPHELELSEEKKVEETQVVLDSPVEADAGSDPGQAVFFL